MESFLEYHKMFNTHLREYVFKNRLEKILRKNNRCVCFIYSYMAFDVDINMYPAVATIVRNRQRNR